MASGAKPDGVRNPTPVLPPVTRPEPDGAMQVNEAITATPGAPARTPRSAARSSLG